MRTFTHCEEDELCNMRDSIRVKTTLNFQACANVQFRRALSFLDSKAKKCRFGLGAVTTQSDNHCRSAKGGAVVVLAVVKCGEIISFLSLIFIRGKNENNPFSFAEISFALSYIRSSRTYKTSSRVQRNDFLPNKCSFLETY